MQITKMLWAAVAVMFVIAAGAALWGPGPDPEPAVKVRQIVVMADMSKPDGVELARLKIEEIHEHLKRGANFQELARNESEALNASDGGDMGWIGRGILPRRLEEMAFEIEPGQYSEIIEEGPANAPTYRILYVESRRNF